MLRSLKALLGYAVVATDGDIGTVHDFYFHDDSWIIRYLVVDTGHWLPGRKVLIPPGMLGQSNWTNSTFPVTLTREQVEKSPDIDTDKPISRQHELDLHNHFGWPAYWIDPGFGPTPVMMPIALILESATPAAAATQEKGDPHLWSFMEVRGYHIHASDGEIGHVEDFVVDDEFWVMRGLVVDTRNWLPGKQVFVSPQWLGEIRDLERRMEVSLTREHIRDCPEFDPAAPVGRECEARLYDFSVRSHQLRITNMQTYTDTERYVELPREEVARRALRLWKAAGQPTGRDLEYWLQAEVELLSERLGTRLNRAINAAAA
jgi:sporulation protein YlmC with PRC-barrel domain